MEKCNNRPGTFSPRNFFQGKKGSITPLFVCLLFQRGPQTRDLAALPANIITTDGSNKLLHSSPPGDSNAEDFTTMMTFYKCKLSNATTTEKMEEIQMVLLLIDLQFSKLGQCWKMNKVQYIQNTPIYNLK